MQPKSRACICGRRSGEPRGCCQSQCELGRVRGFLRHGIASIALTISITGIDDAGVDGEGKWQLFIDADQDIQAMSLLESKSGHLANLSSGTAVRRRSPAADTRQRLAAHAVEVEGQTPL